jgi:hypothetical protein
VTFEHFAACVQDWTSRLTPEQVRRAASSILVMVDDLPPGTTLDAALAMVINGAGVAPQSTSKRAREFLRGQLKHGPKSAAQIEAAAYLADIPKDILIAAASALKVRTQRGRWRLPG